MDRPCPALVVCHIRHRQQVIRIRLLQAAYLGQRLRHRAAVALAVARKRVGQALKRLVKRDRQQAAAARRVDRVHDVLRQLVPCHAVIWQQARVDVVDLVLQLLKRILQQRGRNAGKRRHADLLRARLAQQQGFQGVDVVLQCFQRALRCRGFHAWKRRHADAPRAIRRHVLPVLIEVGLQRLQRRLYRRGFHAFKWRCAQLSRRRLRLNRVDQAVHPVDDQPRQRVKHRLVLLHRASQCVRLRYDAGCVFVVLCDFVVVKCHSFVTS